MQSVVTGRLGKSVREFYGMTLKEINNAIDGFQQLKKEEFQEQLYTARIVAFWAYKGFAGKKLKKYEQILELESDVQARRERLRNMKPVEIIYG